MAFTSNDFKQQDMDENIQHSFIVTEKPRGNGQVERTNDTPVFLLKKLASPTPKKQYKHVDIVQQQVNATLNCSTGKTQSQLLFGVNIRFKKDLNLLELLENKWTFDENR